LVADAEPANASDKELHTGVVRLAPPPAEATATHPFVFTTETLGCGSPSRHRVITTKPADPLDRSSQAGHTTPEIDGPHHDARPCEPWLITPVVGATKIGVR
jgi:hypothetical protein